MNSTLGCSSEQVKLPYESGLRIYSHPPRLVVLIQIVAVAAFTSLVVSLSSVPTISLALLTASAISFIGHRIYKVFICKDPLVEFFDKMTTPNEKKETTPLLQVYLLDPHKWVNQVFERVQRYEMANSHLLPSPIYKINFVFASAADDVSSFGKGGRALLVKMPDSNQNHFLFVERFSPFVFKNMPNLEKLKAIAWQLFSPNNQFAPVFLDRDKTIVVGNISTDLANEFLEKYKKI